MHCAQGNAFCADAKAVKFGETKPSHTAVTDSLPDEPGGYTGYQALFGHKYIAPEFGGGKPNVTHNGFQVTNAAGNLVDENGNQINGAFLTNYPGFPGYSNINASQALAYGADMLENGVPVVSMYMADLHGNEFIPSLSGTGGPCHGAPDALGSGSACFVAQAQYYNAAFGTFFKRLAADGITAKNTLFIVSSDEGDHQAGANVGRSIEPTPANCDGATVSGDTVTPDLLCTYPAGSFGELDGNLNGLLASQEHITTPFSLEADTAPEFYLTGDPGPNKPVVRNFERGVAGLTADNPYAGGNQKIANYLADPAEMAILHMVNADPARTPTFAMFAKPDYYLQTGPATCSGPCVTQDTGFAWDHGDYAAEIDTNYVGFVGPGVRHLGLDGSAANQGPNSAGPNSGQVTVPDEHTKGPWVDETDIRPTIMYLLGLTDDYEHDGRVITQILSQPNTALSAHGVAALGECYKQLNSSVGDVGTDTLIASTEAIKSKSAGDVVSSGAPTGCWPDSTSSGTGSPRRSRENWKQRRSRTPRCRTSPVRRPRARASSARPRSCHNRSRPGQPGTDRFRHCRRHAGQGVAGGLTRARTPLLSREITVRTATPAVRASRRPERLIIPRARRDEGMLAMAETNGEVALRDPDVLVKEIERTREDLARTIDTLTQRVSPANVARRAMSRVVDRLSQPEVQLAAGAAVVAAATLAFLVWRRRRG